MEPGSDSVDSSWKLYVRGWKSEADCSQGGDLEGGTETLRMEDDCCVEKKEARAASVNASPVTFCSEKSSAR